jgi:hypothetical protein
VLVRRENGTAATPKLLAFLDLATNRLFYQLVFFEARGGVRNIDVISAFVEMCKDPAFGVPQYLYCDNLSVTCRKNSMFSSSRPTGSAVWLAFTMTRSLAGSM